jgi:hypothetical protein
MQALPATQLLLAKGVFGLSSLVAYSIEVHDKSNYPTHDHIKRKD